MSLKNLFRTKSVSRILKDAAETDLDADSLPSMSRQLGVRDLTALGIAAIIGAGIFASVGKVCYEGGPGVIFLYVFVAIACGFSAMCYASFSSMIPISGSAYTYAYASFGELIAWIIGWDLIIEYAIGNIAVAIGWSGYFVSMLAGFGIDFPAWLAIDHGSALKAFSTPGADITMIAYKAYASAPEILGMPFIINLPAFVIVALISSVTYIGIKESRNITNIMVLLKVAVVILVILAGAYYVKPANWHPFFPHGIDGVLKGVSGVFFAYIGFDAISTTAEECKNPQRDLPRGMIYSLLICTVLYILVALVVTGMVKSDTLEGKNDPLAYIFSSVGQDWIFYIVSVSAIIAIASVLIVFQLGQPRIWMSMSRDGLLPKIFSRIHPRFRTPSFATIVTGIMVAVPALFLDMSFVLDMTSVGTLFAFVLVCGGILILDNRPRTVEPRFKIPYLDSKYFLLAGWVIYLTYGIANGTLISSLAPGHLHGIVHAIPMYIFFITTLVITIISFKYRISFIPVAGLLSCLYLMSEIPVASWWRFFIWLVIGIVIYFTYSRFHSKLSNDIP